MKLKEKKREEGGEGKEVEGYDDGVRRSRKREKATGGENNTKGGKRRRKEWKAVTTTKINS